MLIKSLLRPLVSLLSLIALIGCTPGLPTGPQVDVSRSVIVALLVPQGTGDAQREALADSLVNAARLANSDLQGVSLDLRIYPTGTDAAAAAETAVSEGAKIIVGPFFGTETASVAPIAAARGINVLSFSNNTQIAGANVFLLGQTFENTADRIVGFSVARGLRNIGVVHPQGADGDLAAAAVSAAAAKRGAQVVATGSYPLSVEGISTTARDIAGQMRGAGVNTLVLTDGPTGGLSYITETLRGLGLRQGSVQFAGLHRWDTSAQALGQPGLQGGWFAAPDPAIAALFASRYQSAYGTAPLPLAALAYDGVAAVGALVAEAQRDGSSDPFAAARLTQSSGFAGVSGVFRFLANGHNERALAVFEVAEGTARMIDPAPRAFGAAGS